MNNQNQTPNPSDQNQAEALEDQNIFDLLGVADGDDDEKEAFLDELQQVIWEDFLHNDVKLLLTQEDFAQVEPLLEKIKQSETDDLSDQEELLTKLEELVPEIEEIMLEKALELKSALFRERIAGMRDFHADKQEQLDAIAQAEVLMAQDKWFSAAQMLNAV